MDLSEGYEAYYAARRAAGSRKVKQIARRGRKFDREEGPVTFQPKVTDVAVLDALIAWKRAQYAATGVYDMFKLGWPRKLLVELLTCDSPRLTGRFGVLFRKGEPVAGDLGMRCGAVLHSWYAAYDDAFSRHSPGHVCSLESAEAAAADGIARIELGKGPEDYKAEPGQRQRAGRRGGGRLPAGRPAGPRLPRGLPGGEAGRRSRAGRRTAPPRRPPGAERGVRGPRVLSRTPLPTSNLPPRRARAPRPARPPRSARRAGRPSRGPHRRRAGRVGRPAPHEPGLRQPLFPPGVRGNGRRRAGGTRRGRRPRRRAAGRRPARPARRVLPVPAGPVRPIGAAGRAAVRRARGDPRGDPRRAGRRTPAGLPVAGVRLSHAARRERRPGRHVGRAAGGDAGEPRRRVRRLGRPAGGKRLEAAPQGRNSSAAGSSATAATRPSPGTTPTPPPGRS